MKKIILTAISLAFMCYSTFAASFFTGYAGGKIGYSSTAIPSEDENAQDELIYDPELKLQAFFAGQFNITQNIWGRLEFSIDTEDFLSKELFTSTQSQFQIDELSLTIRKQNFNFTNYFSTFMGTYDPIGSDIFLQRYFSIEPIASKLTDSWLGLAGSILYPHFGIGISDILRYYSQPIAGATYIYVNNSDKTYILNTDVRAAMNYRFFTCDFAAGLGIPLSNKYHGEDIIIAIDTVYWHLGTTLLLGNNYTQSLYVQAGIYNGKFTSESKESVFSPDDLYLLVEPRIFTKNYHFNLTAYSLPQQTVDKLLYIDDTFGINFNFYTEPLSIQGSPLTFGCHTSLSFSEKTIFDIQDFASFFAEETRCFNVNVIPYISTNFLNGEFNALFKIRCIDFLTKEWYEAFSADIGYKCKL